MQFQISYLCTVPYEPFLKFACTQCVLSKTFFDLLVSIFNVIPILMHMVFIHLQLFFELFDFPADLVSNTYANFSFSTFTFVYVLLNFVAYYYLESMSKNEQWIDDNTMRCWKFCLSSLFYDILVLLI